MLLQKITLLDHDHKPGQALQLLDTFKTLRASQPHPHLQVYATLEEILRAEAGTAGPGTPNVRAPASPDFAATTATVPESVKLQENYPNPFNPITVIPFTLPAAAHVSLAVYNVVGRKVAHLVDRRMSAGLHRVRRMILLK